MAMNRFGFLALPIATASIALAACGGGGESPDRSGSSEADRREAVLEHAGCMREHGIDFPDPTFERGGGIKVELPRNAEGTQALQRAEEVCQKYLDQVPEPDLSPEEKRDFREAALRHTRCMREQGIDLPAPTFTERGVQMRLPKGVSPESPRFLGIS